MTEISTGFTGSYRYSIDSKNRISIPSRLRRCIVSESDKKFFILSDKDDRCIKLYPQSVFRKIQEVIDKANSFDPKVAYLKRRLFAKTYETDMDNQFRIKLDPELMKKNNINGECLIIGMGDYIEIWNPEEFDKYMEETSEKFQGDFGELLASVMNENK